MAKEGGLDFTAKNFSAKDDCMKAKESSCREIMAITSHKSEQSLTDLWWLELGGSFTSW